MKIPHSVVGRTSPSSQGLAPVQVDGITPDAFGAGIGRGLGNIGQAIGQFGARLEQEKKQQSLFNVKRDTINETMETQAWLQRKENEAPLGADGFADTVNNELERRHQSILDDMRQQGESPEVIDQMELNLLEVRRATTVSAIGFQQNSRTVRAERDLTQVGESLSRIAAGNPYEVETALATWDAAVADIPGLDAITKEKLRNQHLDAITMAAGLGLASQSPDIVVEYLSPTGFHNQLINEIIQQESSGNPLAVSPKGATGLMQVMPDTAAEIADTINDLDFPMGGSPEQVREYLSDPDVSRRYGSFYFNQQLERFGGDVEAALVAYNAGPSRAEQWLFSGKDDNMLPAETRNYYREITERFALNGSGVPDVEFVDATANKVRNLPVQQWVQDGAAKAAFATDPNIGIKITSGGQDAAGQAKLGSSGRHTHGNAMDIVLMRNGVEVTPGQDPELYAKFLENAAAAGFTGIGHYGWGVHVGGGSDAAWGPDKTSATLDPVFGEAIARGRAKRGSVMPKELVAQGLTGNPILDKLTPSQRQQVLGQAQTEMSRRQAQARSGLETRVANASAAYMSVGEYGGQEPSIEEFYTAYDSNVAEQKWAEFQNTRDVGQFVQNMKTQSAEDIANELNRLRPEDTSSPTYALDLASYEQAQTAAANVMKAREDDPAGYVMQHFPAVQQAFSTVASSENPSLARTEAYYAMGEAYRQMGLRPSQMEPIPSAQLALMREQFASLTPEQKVGQLVGWRGEMGEMYGAGLQQLADNGMVVEAYLSGLVSESPQHQAIAANVLRGLQIIAQDPSMKPAATDVHAAYRGIMGETQRALGSQVNAAVIEAATALYIADGGAPDMIMQQDFSQYVNQILGGLPNTNDTGMQDFTGWGNPVQEKTILPPGVRRSEFESWQDGLTQDDLLSLSPTTGPFYDGGVPATADDIANEGIFVRVAPGQYIVKMGSDGNPLVDQDGGFYRMQLSPALVKSGTIRVGQ